MKLQNETLSHFLYGVKIENTSTDRIFTRFIVIQEDASFRAIAEVVESQQDKNDDWMLLAIEYLGMVDIYAKTGESGEQTH